MDGYGLYIKKRSGIYVGDWKNDKAHGKGKYFDAHLSTY